MVQNIEDKYSIFYSWQSDLPNSTNRSFIEKAMKKAIKTINSDETIDIIPRIDKDTEGVPGSPDIKKVIFDKISNSKIFVADVSIINIASETRKTPNPNVLIELGYAMNAINYDSVILVMNTAFGNNDNLPFDLKTHRIMNYHCEEKLEKKSDARNKLAKEFERAIKLIFLENLTPKVSEYESIKSSLEHALNENKSNKKIVSKKCCSFLIKELEGNFTVCPGDNDEQYLVDSLRDSVSVIKQFSEIIHLISDFEDVESFRGFLTSYSEIFDHYCNPTDFRGVPTAIEFDYYKFIGYELLVIITSILLNNKNWELLKELFRFKFNLKNYRNNKSIVTYEYATQSVMFDEYFSKNYSGTVISPQGKFVRISCDEFDLTNVISFQDFIEADLLLYLRSQFNSGNIGRPPKWMPWSFTYIEENLPAFIQKMHYVDYAKHIFEVLEISGVEEFNKEFPQIIEYAFKLCKCYGYVFFSAALQVDKIHTE